MGPWDARFVEVRSQAAPPHHPVPHCIFTCLQFPFTDIAVVFVVMILRSSRTTLLNTDTYLECGVRAKAYQLIP